MTHDRRVLVFYPHNYVELASGTHARFFQLARYFRDRGVTADLISFDGFTNRWEADSIRNARHFFHSVSPIAYRDPPRPRFWKRRREEHRLDDLTTAELRNAWKDSFSQARYSHGLVSYAYWGSLVDATPSAVTTVLDLHDCLTLNHMLRTGDSFTGYGKMLEDECRIISKFDHALSISQSETGLLGSLCTGVTFHDIPVACPLRLSALSQAREYDLLFVGSENYFNCRGLQWFFEKVLPLVGTTPRVAVAGRVCGAVTVPQHVRAFHHVADLDPVYAATRLVICPLLGGTGLKVKVIDALCHGVPVITTTWGVDGAIPGFLECCVVADSASAFAAAIDDCLTKPERISAMGEKARAYATTNYSDEAVWGRLDHVFKIDEHSSHA
jgi:glycosyltransferase involved in cell wall biosynthesis